MESERKVKESMLTSPFVLLITCMLKPVLKRSLILLPFTTKLYHTELQNTNFIILKNLKYAMVLRAMMIELLNETNSVGLFARVFFNKGTVHILAHRQAFLSKHTKDQQLQLETYIPQIVFQVKNC